jgi:hypothetical protein
VCNTEPAIKRSDRCTHDRSKRYPIVPDYGIDGHISQLPKNGVIRFRDEKSPNGITLV